MITYSQTTWQVCVAEPDAGVCGGGQVGVFTPGNLVIQQGDMIEFTSHNILLGGYSLSWHDIQFDGSSANNVMLQVPNVFEPPNSVTTPPFNTPGIYQMECHDFTHCLLSAYLCDGYTVEVQGSCAVTADFTTTALDFCTGDIIDFTNTSTGASSYIWHLDEFTFATTTDAVLSFGSAATHDIELIADDGAGCLDSTTITINIDQASDAGSDNSDIFCNINDSIDLNTLLDGDLGGNWNETTSSGQFNATSGFLDYTDLTEDDYSFEYVVPGVGVCPNDTAIIDIEINQEPHLAFNFSNVNIASSDSLYIDFTLTGVNGSATYVWNYCDGNFSTDNSPFWHKFDTAGTYCVCVQVNNGNGCVETFCDSNIVVFDDAGLDLLNEIDFSIYPNPANEKVNLKFGSIHESVIFELRDVNSRIISTEEIYSTIYSFDVSSIEPGIYFISILSEKGRTTKSLVVR
jgi:PKD repeat protein